MTLVVNFYGGPGTGKSTMAAHVFAELKWQGINSELITEYAKDKVWEGSFKVLDNQTYVFGKQYHKIYRVSKQVDVLLVDSPLLLSLIYDSTNSYNFRNYVLEKYDEFHNLNYFLIRTKPYNAKGRVQDEGESKEIDGGVYKMLVKENINFITLNGSRSSVPIIVDYIIELLSIKNTKDA